LFTAIILGWKQTLAYDDTTKIMTMNSHIVQSLGVGERVSEVYFYVIIMIIIMHAD
jgi:hypothetical protein